MAADRVATAAEDDLVKKKDKKKTNTLTEIMEKALLQGIMMYAAQNKFTLSLQPRSLQTEQTVYQRTRGNGIIRGCRGERACQYQRITVVTAGKDTGNPRRY